MDNVLLQCPIGFEGNGIVCLPDSDLDGIVDEKVRKLLTIVCIPLRLFKLAG